MSEANITEDMIKELEGEEAVEQEIQEAKAMEIPDVQPQPKEVVTPPPVEKMEKKKITVTLDFSDEKVLSLAQDEGYDVFFASKPSEFKKLPLEVFSELPKMLRDRYVVSEKLNEKEKDVSFAEFQTTGRLARASARLKIHNPKPGSHYAWVAPRDMRDRAYEGYRVCEDPDVQTFGGEKDGPKRVGALGQTELVLMETSQENADKRMALIGEKSRQRVDGSVRKGMTDLEGHLPFIPKDKEDPARYPFSPVRKE